MSGIKGKSGIYIRTKKMRKNMSIARIGKEISKETKLKISKSSTGENSSKGMLGKKHSIETKKKMSISHKGEKNPKWIKDRSKLKKFNDLALDRRSSAYANWRKDVLKRDNNKCKINNKDCKGRLEVHHILSYTNYPELRYDINNGITLCHAHHPRTRAKEKRLSPYFKELVSVSKV